MLESRFNFNELEHKIYEKWENSGAFKVDVATADINPDNNFSIMMPPPNVTGIAHLGHALDNSLQDVIVRFNRMCGKSVLWQPGMDHAGIMAQMVVEKQMDKEGISRYDLGRSEFIKRMWNWKNYSGGQIVKQLRALGISPDWSRARFTMDDLLSKAVLKFFVSLYKDGLIYKDLRLVNWDIRLQTAISDVEVELREEKKHMYYLKYQIKNINDFILVATTRPETIFVDAAVAVHPDNKQFNHLIGKTVIVPICGKEIPIIADEYADPNKGSGFVKITPAHDFNDYEVGKRHNLSCVSVFDLNGKMNSNAPTKYQGLDRLKVRDIIVSNLDELGLLDHVENIVSSVPYGERSGTIIEPMQTEQWFVDTETLVKKYGVIDIVKNGIIKFIPKYRENTYFHFMENIRPWCISRSLWWGHQIPVWYGMDGKQFCEMTEEEAYAAAEKFYGKKLLPDDLKRDENVLDTWFSSALWPFATLGWGDSKEVQDKLGLSKFYPNTLLITGFDIIFFWVARMIMAGMYCMHDVLPSGDSHPFNTVFIHGLIRDSKGQKMSKSKGNGVDPIDMINKYSADALRAYLVSQVKPGADIKFNENQLTGWRDFSTKLWNAAKFFELNEVFDSNDLSDNDFLDIYNLLPDHDINKWITNSAFSVFSKVTNLLNEYNFSDAIMCLYDFVWDTFCSFYIEMVKVVFESNDNYAKQTKTISRFIFKNILKYLHPFMPFITEELWDNFYGNSDKPLLILERFSTFEIKKNNDNYIDNMLTIIKTIRSFKSNIGNVNKVIDCNINVPLFKPTDLTSKIISKIARVNIVSSFGSDSIELPVLDGILSFNKSDNIDWFSVKKLLNKDLLIKEKYVFGMEAKFNNQSFMTNAEPDLINDMKKNTSSAKLKIMELNRILKSL